jgi:hypothetical protein
MASSNSYDWSLTANGIINEALEDLGVIIPGGTPATAITTSALAVLQRVTKALSAKGIRVWSVDWVMKTFSAPSCVVGTDGKYYTCILSGTQTTAHRPITGANYRPYWTERTGTLSTTWSAGAYTSPSDFDADAQTLNILQANIQEGDTTTPIEVLGMEDYFAITDKYRNGKPTALYFDRLKTGHIYLYPQLDADNYDDYTLHYLRESVLEDFDAVANDPDFQSIYLDYLIKELRFAYAPKTKKTMDELAFYKKERDDALNILRMKEMSKKPRSIEPSFSLSR